MGYGDNIMATGLAKGAHSRGKRIAFGDGQKIIWDHNSEPVFRGNPNIAGLGSEGAADLEWIPFHLGSRLYNRQEGDRWKWNMDWRPIPGEIYFNAEELRFAEGMPSGAILLEPNVPRWKSSAVNKDWGWYNWQKLGRQIFKSGRAVYQLYYPDAHQLDWVPKIKTPSFRQAMAMVKRSAMFITTEGGLHHAAAAVGTKAVVIFGGFIPPKVTGYETHINLAGSQEFCGSLKPCEHCKEAMKNISVDQVHEAIGKLSGTSSVKYSA